MGAVQGLCRCGLRILAKADRDSYDFAIFLRLFCPITSKQGAAAVYTSGIILLNIQRQQVAFTAAVADLNRLAADLAVFNIALALYGQVEIDTDGFPAKGALNTLMQ